MDFKQISNDMFTPTIESIKDSVEILRSLAVKKESESEKSIYKNEAKLTKVFSSVCNVIEEMEVKSLTSASSLTDFDMTGVWSEEDKIFLDRYTLKNLFKDEHWVYVIVDLIASKISSQALKIYKKVKTGDKETIEEAPNHPYMKVIENPNEFQSYYEWMYCCCVDLVLIGEAIIWGGVNWQRLYHFPVETIDIDINAAGTIVSYDKYANTDDYQSGKFIGKYNPEEIIQIKKPNPSSLYYGFSPFVPSRKPILFNRFSTEYLNNYYLKGAVGGVYLKLASDQNFGNIQRLMRTYESAYVGRRSQRRTKLLPPGVDPVNVSETLAEQSLESHLKMNKQDILATLKVPAHEVGLQTSGSLGSEEYKTALKNFWQATLIPYMKFISGKMTKRLQSVIGPDYFFQFDLADVEILKENEKEKALLSKEMLAVLTPNEIRDKVWSLGPLPNEDSLVSSRQAAMSPFGFSSPIPQAKEIKEDKPQMIQPRIDVMTFEKQADSLIKASGNWFEDRKRNIEKATNKPIKDVTKLFVNLISKQAIEIIKRINRITKSINLEDEKRIKQEIARAMDDISSSFKKEYYEAYRAKLDDFASLTFDHPYYAGEKETLSKVLAEARKNTQKFVEKRRDWVFDKIKATNQDMIFRALDNIAKDSNTIQELTRKISEHFSDKKNVLWRAERIARTETLTILRQSQNDASRKAKQYFPDLEKMWISTKDDRTRGAPNGLWKNSKADHWHMHGQIKKFDEDFIDPENQDKLGFPGDPKGKPESVINCRCTFITLPQKEMQVFTETEREAKPNPT
jgi:HK97 family phage portal protein